MANTTQQQIIHGFLKLLHEKPFDKITVKDICELCEINRNTFYYHFRDIYNVLETLLLQEQELAKQDEREQETFYEEYVRRYHFIIEHRKAVLHLYCSKNRDLILQYFYTITELFVEKYVRKAAEGRKLSEEDVRFAIDFYSNSIIGNILLWLQHGMQEDQEKLIYRLSLSYKATIGALLDELEMTPGDGV